MPKGKKGQKPSRDVGAELIVWAENGDEWIVNLYVQKKKGTVTVTRTPHDMGVCGNSDEWCLPMEVE